MSVYVRVFPTKNSIQLIKLLRDTFGLGLLESKRWIDKIPPEGAQLPAPLTPEMASEFCSGAVRIGVVAQVEDSAAAVTHKWTLRKDENLFMEFNRKGQFRLVVNGERSRWTPYEAICEFRGYMGFTQYWSGHERIVRISNDIKLKPHEVVNVCIECGKPTGWNGETYAPDVCEHEIAAWDKMASMSLFTGGGKEAPTPAPIREAK